MRKLDLHLSCHNAEDEINAVLGIDLSLSQIADEITSRQVAQKCCWGPDTSKPYELNSPKRVSGVN